MRVPCEVCGRIDRRQVRGVCVECWPRRREIDKAEAAGAAAHGAGNAKNPYDEKADYDLHYAWERAYEEGGRPVAINDGD